jgi:CheY-like chemotaxis protein
MTASPPVRQVLYVEDQPVNVMLMEAVFEQRPDLRLVVATDCTEARALAPRIRPELLLLDLRLPDGNGHELLPQLRQRPGWSQLGAIAVTAEPEIEPHATGFDELWPKPLDLDLVRRRLDSWLPRARHAHVDVAATDTWSPSDAGDVALGLRPSVPA